MNARRWTILIVVLSAACMLIAGARTLGQSRVGTPGKADKVVVVGVPGLAWSALSPTGTPHLWAAADKGAVGLITDRAGRAVTCPWDGWVTLGAGNRARYPAPLPESDLPPVGDLPLPGEGHQGAGGVPASPGGSQASAAPAGCLGQTGAVPVVGGSTLTPVVTENDKLGFGAVPGALGKQMRCTTTIGPDPVLAVGADGADVSTAARPGDVAGWAAVAGQCPLTLVSSDTAVGKTPEQLHDLDAQLGAIIDGARLAGASVIVAGIAQPVYRSARLQAIIALGNGFAGKILGSPSTGRTPYIQLIDIAPTVIQLTGGTAPASMVGRPATTIDRDQPLAATVAGFTDLASAASAHVWIANDFFTVLTVICILASLLLLVAIKSRWRPRRWLQIVAVAAGTLPAASYLCNLVPWWRAGSPGTAIVLVIACASAVLTAICFAGPWRRHDSGPPMVAAGLTVTVLAVDILTGSSLSINAPLGYDAIVAGRFTGLGGLSFAVFAGALMMIIALAASVVAGSRARLITVTVATGVAAVTLTAAPGAGDKFGGAITLVPALLLFGLIAMRVRVSPWRLLLTLLGGAAVAMVVAVGDYLRPARSQTHLGRFVGQILDGTAWTVIGRKLHSNLGLLVHSVFTPLTIVLVLVCVLVYRDAARQAVRYLTDHAPFAAAAAIAIIALAVVGLLVNDSGIAVPGGVLAVAVPLTLSIVARQECSKPPARRRRNGIRSAA